MTRSALARGLSAAGSGLGVFLLAASWESAFHLVPAGDGVWRGVSDPPTAARLALAMLFGLAVAALAWRLEARVSAPLALLSLAGAPLLPVLTGRGALLLALQGPTRVLLVCAVLSLFAVRALSRRDRGTGRAPEPLLFAGAFAFYALLATRLPGPAGPQGDEPHYLLMCESLVSDGDLDLTDDYANREYAPFYAGTLVPPHVSPSSPPGRTYSSHSPGLAFLILPAYASGGYAGVRLFLGALVAWAGVLVYRLVRESLGGGWPAAAAWAAVSFTPPLPLFAMRVYPETVATLATAVFLLSARQRPTWRSAGAAAVAACVLPWLHSKMLLLAAVGLGLTLVRPASWRLRAAALAAFALSVAGLLWFFRSLYGTPALSAAFGPPQLAAARIPRGLGAVLFDRQFGLFALAPLWLLAVPGWVALARQRAGDALRALLLVLPSIGVASAFATWWAGWCPPARFLVPAIPGAALALAALLPGRRDWVVPSAALGLGFVALAADAPRILNNRADGESLVLRHLSASVDLNGLLPSFFDAGWGPVLLALSLAAWAALGWRFGWRGGMAGALGYGLVAFAWRDRPLLDRRLATSAILEAWDGDNWWSPQGPPPVSRLELPFELPRGPWLLDPDDLRLSRRIDVPPGHYRFAAEARAEAGAAARLTLRARDVDLAELELSAAHPRGELDLTLPVGARGLGVAAAGESGRIEVQAVRLIPEALVPRSRRADFSWPEQADAGRYRVERGGVRVTALDRVEPEGEGFRLAGAGGRFVLEGGAGARVSVEVVRGETHANDRVIWNERVYPLGRLRAVTLHERLEGGVELSRGHALPIRVEAKNAWIRFRALSPDGGP